MFAPILFIFEAETDRVLLADITHSPRRAAKALRSAFDGWGMEGFDKGLADCANAVADYTAGACDFAHVVSTLKSADLGVVALR